MEINLDAYNSLLENFGNKVWVKINKRFLVKVFSEIKNKKISEDNIDQRWLKYERHPQFKEFHNLCKKLNISKDELYSKIKYFKYGKQGKWVKINRILPLSEDVAYFLGLFAGEGTKSMSKQLQISNTNIQIIKFVRNFYEKSLNVKKESIKAYVGLPLNIKDFDKSKFESSFRLEENIYCRYESYRRKIKVSLTATSGIYRLIIECLLKHIPSIAKNKNLGLSYLRGLSDGEGCISKSGNRMVFVISMNNSHFLDIAELVLLKYGCKTRREKPKDKKSTKDRLIIHARDFSKLKEIKIFRFRKESLKKLNCLNKEIKEHHSIRGRMIEEFIDKLYNLQRNNISLDTKEISHICGLSSSHVAFLMKISEQRGLLNRFRKTK